jgi:ribosome-associated protein
MAIKKFHRNEGREDYTSKTSIKLDAHALTKWGKELLQLPESLLIQLPFNGVTLKSLLDYPKITSNLARKRHLMFIGKCLRKEDEDLIRETLLDVENKRQTKVPKPIEPINPHLKQLIDEGDAAIETILLENANLERQKLRQLHRNYSNSKGVKKDKAMEKLKLYLV